MAIDRRTFLTGMAAGSSLAVGDFARAAKGGRTDFVAARADESGQFWLTGVRASGTVNFDLPIPGRGHGAALDPSRPRVVMFARRPQTFAIVVDLANAQVNRTFEAPAGRHFFGHGIFAPDGRFLYATENDIDGRRGVIGVYDSGRQFRRVRELPAFGIGPHEIRMMPDGETLAVANGGILTHPSLPRMKLNIPTMRPNLALVDRKSGQLRRMTELPRAMHRASIRHLAVSPGGDVAIGLQYQGPRKDQAPVVGIVGADGALRLGDPAAPATRSMRHYCGSIEFDQSANIIAASAPRGNVVTFWDARACRPIGSVSCIDACGVTPLAAPYRFLITSGRGEAIVADVSGQAPKLQRLGPFPGVRWDNHLISVG